MKTNLPLAVARDVANQLVAYLKPNCKRIEVAGSIRRCKPEIGDIELMVVPTVALYDQLDAYLQQGQVLHSDPKRWGNKLRSFRFPVKMVVPTVALYDQLDAYLRQGQVLHSDPKRWGNKLRSFRFPVKVLDEHVQVDLFLQPDPSTWGVNMLLRTGSAEFSRKMVTKRSEGGFMPDCYQVREARVWAGAKLLETPEEEDIFALWGMDYVLPPQRTDHYAPKLRQAPTVEVEPEPVQIGLFG